MWIITQDNDYVHSDNIYVIAIRKCTDGYEIYADSSDDKRVKLGVYNDYESAADVLDKYFSTLVNDDVFFELPPKDKTLQWDEIDKMSMKGVCHGEQKEDHT